MDGLPRRSSQPPCKPIFSTGGLPALGELSRLRQYAPTCRSHPHHAKRAGCHLRRLPRTSSPTLVFTSPGQAMFLLPGAAIPPRCHDAVSSLQPSRSIHSFTSCEVGSTSEPLSETLRYSRRGRTRPGCFGRLSSKLANGFEPSPAKTSAEPFQPRYSYQAR